MKNTQDKKKAINKQKEIEKLSKKINKAITKRALKKLVSK